MSRRGSPQHQPDPLEQLPTPTPFDPATEVHVDALVHETHPSSSLTGEQGSLHFLLADERNEDDGIPPKGFRIADAAAPLSVPRWHGQTAPDDFTAAGGDQRVTLTWNDEHSQDPAVVGYRVCHDRGGQAW